MTTLRTGGTGKSLMGIDGPVAGQRRGMDGGALTGLKGHMDGLLADADQSKATGPQDLAAFSAAKQAFLAAGPELLAAATQHLWAYYRHVAGEFDAEDRAEYGIPELDGSSDIWDEVALVHPPALTPGGTSLEPGGAYLSFEGEVSWEDEHGLQLVFEDGRTLCKVSPYDGHVTNAHAYGNASLLGTVFPGW